MSSSTLTESPLLFEDRDALLAFATRELAGLAMGAVRAAFVGAALGTVAPAKNKDKKMKAKVSDKIYTKQL